MRGEGYRPFQLRGVFIPLEKVGVRGRERRPGERRLSIVRPSEPEQPKTLLHEMQQYIADRQVMREHGYFVAAGQEPRIDIPRADAIHNDLRHLFSRTIKREPSDLSSLGNIPAMWDYHNEVYNVLEIFDAYAICQMSEKKQRRILWFEALKRLLDETDDKRRLRPRQQLDELTPGETETVSWLLRSVGASLPVKDGRFFYSVDMLMQRKRSLAAVEMPNPLIPPFPRYP